MSKPQLGDKVRVMFEGTVVPDPENMRRIAVRLPHQGVWFAPDSAVEVLEPAWQTGDVVIDAGGDLWTRTGGELWPWSPDGRKVAYPHEGANDEAAPRRPLTLLVRGRKPVTA